MTKGSTRKGFYVVVRREAAGRKDVFRWSIFRRAKPLGVKISESGFPSFHTAHAAGTKALEELVEGIRKEEAG